MVIYNKHCSRNKHAQKVDSQSVTKCHSLSHSFTYSLTHSLCCVAVQIRSLLQSTHQGKISVFMCLWVRGFTVAGKECSELKCIFVSMCRGLTCIQVEPYESEGQSYELCRSERNPADNKKNRLLEQSYTAAGVHRLHRLLGSKSKQTKLINKLAL